MINEQNTPASMDPLPGTDQVDLSQKAANQAANQMDPLPGLEDQLSEMVNNSLLNLQNPFSIEPGPDLNIRTYMHELFNRRGAEPGFNLDDVRTWEPSESKGAVLALVQDYLIEHGMGFDWRLAAERAEMFCAGMYHELLYRAGMSHTPQLHINFYDGFRDEGFELVMNRPMVSLMDPLPGMTGSAQPQGSRRQRASLEVAPTFDALTVSEQALQQSFLQLGQFFDNHGRLALQFTAAFMVMWKALQVIHSVRSGAVYRGIFNQNIPEMLPGDMRLVYARTGERISQASQADPNALTLMLD